jgi:hypothetical protein
MPQQSNIYNHVLTITEDYLGPAAPRFLSRLATNHLNKPASRITRADLPQLVVWIKLAATIITDNEAVVTEYLMRLENLSTRPHKEGVGDTATHLTTPA